MVDIETVKFIEMLNELAIKFNGEKGAYAFCKDKDAIALNARLNKFFCLNHLIYDDKDDDDLGFEVDDARVYPVVNEIEISSEGEIEIKNYYEGVFAVIHTGEREVFSIIVFTPKMDEEGYEMFAIANGHWYLVK